MRCQRKRAVWSRGCGGCSTRGNRQCIKCTLHKIPMLQTGSNRSKKVQERQKAECNKDAHNKPIPSLFCTDPAHQVIQPGHQTRRARDAAIDARQRLALQTKTLIDSIRLAQHAVDHVVTVIDAPALLQHVFSFGSFWIRSVVGIDIRAYVRQ